MKKNTATKDEPIYEYSITCLACGHRVASGNLSEQVRFSDSEVANKASHNDHCKVPECRTANRIKIENTISTHDHAVVSHYTITLARERGR